jgi:hypothetical protein
MNACMMDSGERWVVEKKNEMTKMVAWRVSEA